MEKRTHNYPKTRKPRNTDYATSTKLINKFGIDRVYEVWAEHGMYKGAEILSEDYEPGVSPFVLRAMSNKYNWKRVVTDPTLAISKAHLRGSVPEGYYKHIIFELKK